MARKKSIDITPPTAQEDRIEWMVQAVILQSASIKELAHEAKTLRESIALFLEEHRDAVHEQIEAIPQLTKEIEILRSAVDDLRQEYEDVMRRQTRLYAPSQMIHSPATASVAAADSSPLQPPPEAPASPASEPGSLW
jgi:phage shock protein A